MNQSDTTEVLFKNNECRDMERLAKPCFMGECLKQHCLQESMEVSNSNYSIRHTVLYVRI